MSFSEKFNIIIPPQDIDCNPNCILRLANGDKEAFAWLYKNYCRKIYNYAFLITGNDAQSEDIVQDVFLKIWTHREILKKVKNFNGYLNMLCRNYTLNLIKRQQKDIYVRRLYCHEMAPVRMADEELAYKESQQTISQAVKKMTQQQQAVYTLSREYGLKRDEIAKELKLAPFTVKGHMQKSLKFLRQQVLKKME